MVKDQEKVEKLTPSKRHPALARLDFLEGVWETTSPQYPDGRGKVTFEWLEGGAFLKQRSQVDNAQFPVAVTLIGLDDTSGAFSMLYYDDRGVSRVYRMSLKEGDWQIWRDAPGFSQRFRGSIGPDGQSIQARWEKSIDGVNWERDFDIIYTKVK